MSLLSISLKEKDREWTKSVSRCAEHFTTIGAIRSSAFQLALADLLVQELELRSRLYLEHSKEQANFDNFFTEQMTSLHSDLKSRFGVSIPGKERYAILQEKYNMILLSNCSPESKLPIGFNCS